MKRVLQNKLAPFVMFLVMSVSQYCADSQEAIRTLARIAEAIEFQRFLEAIPRTLRSPEISDQEIVLIINRTMDNPRIFISNMVSGGARAVPRASSEIEYPTLPSRSSPSRSEYMNERRREADHREGNERRIISGPSERRTSNNIITIYELSNLMNNLTNNLAQNVPES